MYDMIITNIIRVLCGGREGRSTVFDKLLVLSHSQLAMDRKESREKYIMVDYAGAIHTLLVENRTCSQHCFLEISQSSNHRLKVCIFRMYTNDGICK